jgi:hypothetical protein
MKFDRFINVLVGHLILGGALVVCSPQANAQPRGGEQLLQNSSNREQQTQKLDASARREEVEKARREAEKLRAETRRGEDESARTELERFIELQLQSWKLTEKLKELRAAGKDGEAAEVNEHIARLEHELERTKEEVRSRRPQRDPGASLESRERFERDGRQPPGEIPELHRRLRHLQAAIDNLHAAGLHEPAEHLAQEAQRMRQQIHTAPTPQRRAAPRPEPGMRPDRRLLQDEVEPMREEIRKLQEAIQDLRRRVEELSRERQ